MEKKLQDIVDQLTGMDDIFFHKLAEDKGFCEELIQVVLENKTLKVAEYTAQDSIRNIKGRSVVLDLKCVSADDKIINVEIQKENRDDHQRRVRYNAANIDTAESEKGVKFEELKDIYIIYISKFDLFGKDKTIYHINRVINETQDIVENGVHEIYVNTKVDDGTEIVEYMKLLKGSGIPDNPKFPKICGAIKNIKTGMGDDSMCNLVQEYADEEKVKLMVKCYVNDALPVNTAAEMLDMAEEQFLEYVERYREDKVLVELYKEGTLSAEAAAKKLQIEFYRLCGGI